MKHGIALAVMLATAGGATAQSYTASMVYPNPDGDMNTVRRRGPCIDPWVTIALEIVNGRADPALCSTALYNGGTWSSFNQLVHAVKATMTTTGGNATLRVVPVRGAPVAMIGVFSNGALVAAGGGNLVAAGGNLVAAGGGNLVSGDSMKVAIAGNALVAAGGGNLVSPGGGSIAPVASVRNGRQLQSTSKIVAKLPGGGGIGF